MMSSVPAIPAVSEAQTARLDVLRRRLFSTVGATLACADDCDGALPSFFTRRGVADLHNLLNSEPTILRGALVADRVIGLGAAAIMVAAGVAAYTTPVASQAAVALFASYRVPGIADKIVPYIINRDATGPCPLESRLQSVETLPDMLVAIDAFIAEHK